MYTSSNTDNKKKVSILIPMYNEQEVLPALFNRLSDLMDGNPSYMWEVVMVNDGSTDATAAKALQMH